MRLMVHCYQLHPSITPEVIAEAAAAGIVGVKMYPQGMIYKKFGICRASADVLPGVTTNSESGVASDFIEAYEDVFAAMQEHKLVLNLHGEVPGSLPSGSSSLEEAFLPQLKRLHKQFPDLRCILEVSRLLFIIVQRSINILQHCSTAAALNAVRECGSTVAG